VIENMRKRLPNDFLASRKSTLDFMYRTLRVFRGGNREPSRLTEDISDSCDIKIEKEAGCEYLGISEGNKLRIESILADSPFCSDV